MFNLFSSSTKVYKSLDGKAFKDEYAKSRQPVLLDVRTAEEFGSGTINNARNIDIMSPEFHKHISALDKSRAYFVFCRSGGRSGQACNIMAQQGFTVYNLKGGVGSWPR